MSVVAAFLLLGLLWIAIQPHIGRQESALTAISTANKVLIHFRYPGPAGQRPSTSEYALNTDSDPAIMQALRDCVQSPSAPPTTAVQSDVDFIVRPKNETLRWTWLFVSDDTRLIGAGKQWFHVPPKLRQWLIKTKADAQLRAVPDQSTFSVGN